MKQFYLQLIRTVPAWPTKFAVVIMAICFIAVIMPGKTVAQAPVINYGGAKTYLVNQTIAALTPANTGAAVPAGIGYGYVATVCSQGVSQGGLCVNKAGVVYGAYNTSLFYLNPASTPVQFVSGNNYDIYSIAIDAGNYLYTYGSNTIATFSPGQGDYNALGYLSGISALAVIPNGAPDLNANVYFSDAVHGKIYRFNSNGGATFIAGGAPLLAANRDEGQDGTGTSASFEYPSSIAIDGIGNIYVADGAKVRKVTPQGVVTTLAANFSSADLIAVDLSGICYVHDASTHQIFRISPAGAVSVLAGSASNTSTKDGGGTGAGFGFVSAMAVDNMGNLYESESGANGVNPVIRKIGVWGYSASPALPAGISMSTANGIITGTPKATSAGTDYTVTAYNAGGSNNTNLNITVNQAVAPAFTYPGGAKNYVKNVAITQLSPTISNIFAPAYGVPFSIITGILGTGIAFDAAGSTYVADASHHAVLKYSAAGGTSSTLASGINFLSSMAVDAAGNVYYTDQFATTPIYKIPAGGGTAIPIGGTGAAGIAYSQPDGVAVDAAGNVYVADQSNSRIVKIPGGTGTPVVVGSGFSKPGGVAVDPSGNLYIADAGNNAIKMMAGGTGTPTAIGSGFSAPNGVAIDNVGNVFVSDYGNSRVMEIPVGTTTPQFLASISYLFGISVGRDGSLYYGDEGGQRIARTFPTGGYYINPMLPAGITFNPSTGAISGTPTVISPATSYTITGWTPSGFGALSITIGVNIAAPPTVVYISPPAYTQGTTITALTPTSSGVAAPAYNTPQTLVSGLPNAYATAVDGNNTTYTATQHGNVITKRTAAGVITTITVPGTKIWGMAADAAGNIFIADYANNVVKERLVNGTVIILGGASFNAPHSVAVDAAGNVYVADFGSGQVKKLAVGTSNPVTIGSGFTSPAGVAVDAYGNVYVADYATGLIKKIAVADGSTSTLPINSQNAQWVAVDATGNVFVTDYANNLVKEIPIGGTSSVTIASGNGQFFPTGLAVDGAGNVFIADYNSGALKQLTPAGGYFINPALPAGLTLTPTTGAISGTPTISSPATSYSVAGWNNTGGIAAAVTLTVNAPLPTLNYPSIPSFTTGTDIGTITPTSSGVMPGGFSISPSLSAGLNFDVNTGNISGTPTVYGKTYTSYSVTATNATGQSVTFSIALYVGAPLASLSYEVKKTTHIFVVGTPVSPLSPITVTGISNFITISSPTGNHGLKVDNQTGIISGTPNSYTSGAIDFTINVTNVTGRATQTKISIQINAPAAILSYPTPPSYTVGISIDPLIPNINGIVSLSLQDLPMGLQLDFSRTYTISGTPLVIGNYTTKFTLTNVTGQRTTTVLNFQVNAPLPTITYPDYTNPLTYTTGVPIQLLAPQSTGVTPGGFSISPVLPAGLSFDANTGNISGKPAMVSAFINYTVTASNSTGQTATAVLDFGVIDPSGFAYSGPNAYTNNVAITALTPTGNSNISPLAYSTPVSIAAAGLSAPYGIAINAAGTIYVADQTTNKVSIVQQGSLTQVGLTANLNSPAGLAADGMGNIYVTDAGNLQVKELPAGGGNPITVSGAYSYPLGVAADAAGNVFITDYNNNNVTRVPAGGGPAKVIATGFSHPQGIAVDGAGNVYVADASNTAIQKLAAGTYVKSLVSNQFHFPTGVAIDGTGNIFIADAGNNTIYKILAGTKAPVQFATGFFKLTGIAVDGAGNVYITDQGNAKTPASIKEFSPTGGYFINNTLPAGLSFSNATGVISSSPKPTQSSAATNYTVTAYKAGKSALASVNITVNGPPNITYDGPQIYPQGSTIAQLLPSITGSPVTLGFTGALPAGLTLNTTTGAITGTPTALSAATDYTITAKNSYGTSAGAVINITVVPLVAPTKGTYGLMFTHTTVNSTHISWSNGYGTARVVFIQISGNSITPLVNNTTYAANTAFGQGTQIAPGWYCVYNGSGTSVDVTGLNITAATDPYVCVQEYNGTAGSETYYRNGDARGSVPIPVAAMNTAFLPLVNSGATPLITTPGNEQVIANNILSPNGDGINDIWIVKNIAFYPNNTVTVYDRTGVIVFTRKNYQNDWAGTYHGSILSEGTYYYKVDLGNGSVTKGFITVLRDK
jgi:gliding motility-associated-like protein